MKKLSLLDLAFFVTESEESPKHVAGLMLFKRPAKSPASFAKTLFEEFREYDEPSAPFDQVIDFFAMGGPRWRTADVFDIDEHLFYHDPGRAISKAELHELVAGLHGPVLDRSRPLWEFHVIDRVEGGRFAVYFKIHHAYADGVTLASWTAHSLSATARSRQLKPVWVMQGSGKARRRAEAETSGAALLRHFARGAWDQLKTTTGLAKLLAQLGLEQFGLTRHAVSLPFKTASRTPLTGQVTAGRQFAAAGVPMEHVKRIRDMCRATLNHVALTCVDGALHRYLADFGADPDRPISIQMPVNLRSKDDRATGNRIGLVTVDLANRTDDPYERLREIGFTLRNVRNQIDGVAPAAVSQYSIVLGVAAQLMETLKLNNVLPPISDTLVSNVPGPRQPLYLKGAKMEEMCPVSALMPGTHLNITLFSYAGTLYFGLVATRELGDLETLARYIEQAFVDLEEAVFSPRKKQ